MFVVLGALCINSYAQSASAKVTETKSPFLIEKGNTSIKFGGFVRFVTFADFGGGGTQLRLCELNNGLSK